MHVKQVKAEKLKREYQVTIPATTIDEHLAKKLKAIGKDAKIPGFRPGKVPANILKQNYGSRVLGEVLDNVVRETSQQALTKEGVRPALQPKIEVIGEFKEGGDLNYKMELEVLPDVPALDYTTVSLTRPVVNISDVEITKALEKIAGQAKDYKAVERAAATDDAVLIDFKGFLGEEAFEGGAANGHQLVIGSGAFIPGFEEQLIGKKAGDKARVKVTFPEEYHSADLKGKAAEFDVTVHEVREAAPQEINDGLAEKMGFENLEMVKEAIRWQIEGEVKEASRNRCKKQLFDHLDGACVFEVPEQMVALEFDAIWKQVSRARQEEPDVEEFAGKTEADLEAEYRKMAERRVRLGLLLADLGNKEKIAVSRDEVIQAAVTEAQRYRGQEQQVFDFYRNNPQALEMLRGPILEEKVVDFILEKVSVKEQAMTLEELQKPETADSAEGNAKPAKKSSKKA